MNTTQQNYSKLIMLFGLILISGSWMGTAYASNVTIIGNANHRLYIPTAKKIGGTYYVRGEQPMITTIQADYKGTVNLKRDYTLDAVMTYFFRPGERAYSSYSRVGVLGGRRGQVPSRSIDNIRLDFRKACGMKGGIATVVRIKNKSSSDYLRFEQGPMQIPLGGGIVPVVIDCRAPTISKINGFAPDRFNMCVNRHSSYGLPIEMVDDIGIRSVEVSSAGLAISPSVINMDNIRKGSKKNEFKADFSMKTVVSLNPTLSRTGFRVTVTDMAGRRTSSRFRVGLVDPNNPFRVNLAPLRSVAVGQRAAFGVTLIKRSCVARYEQFTWQIIKVPSRTSTNEQSIVATSGNSWVNPHGARTPILATFTPRHSGFYRLKLMDSGNRTAYMSPALQVMPTALRTPHTTKKVRPNPARRHTGPGLERRF